MQKRMDIDRQGGNISTWLRFTVIFMLLAGGVYPFFTTFVASTFFPFQAQGSLLRDGDVLIGSSLVGQDFVSPQYFIGRPSAANHDPFDVSGSNLAPSNPELRLRAAETSRIIAGREGVAASDIPVALIAASGSGIDPHIPPQAAALQVPRVAEARGLSVAEVQALVEQYTQEPTLGLLGMPRVNVLMLNLALDALE